MKNSIINIMRKNIIDQSGVIPYFIKNNEIYIILITSMQTGNWTLPKGLIENNMTAEESAIKEALEECGVIGELKNNFCEEYFYSKWSLNFKVKMYPLTISEIFNDWEEKHLRKRSFFTLKEAINIIKIEQKDILLKFEKYIN
ncbi:MAG: NUDIX hydrolase [Candidatus Sericytochromatia bacterium]